MPLVIQEEEKVSTILDNLSKLPIFVQEDVFFILTERAS